MNLIPGDHRVLHMNCEVSLTMVHKCCKYIANGVSAKVRALLVIYREVKSGSPIYSIVHSLDQICYSRIENAKMSDPA